MDAPVKPVVVASKCLEFAACRYNGLMISSDVVKALKTHVEFIPVCAEVEIGLGVPREPIRVATIKGELRLLQPSTGADLTARMKRFAGEFLDALPAVDGFILKSRSPSCGIKDVKVFRGVEKEAAVGKGVGFFGGAVLETFPNYPVEDEGRLLNFRIREHFLTGLYALARFRAARAKLAMRDLVDYQARNKLLLMSYSQKEMRLLGKIVANQEKKPAHQVFDEYEVHLRAALARPPKYTSNINVLMHTLGYFKDGLGAAEKVQFIASLEKYRAGKTPLSAALAVVNSWLARFGGDYLKQQTYLEPYPEGLVEITDSGKGRDL
ncbi:MAG TPA: DUF523 and DUF1722 domain-containing protein [Candidatus Bathyarchaeia archaeon]|nr:DUF523 and DUF1722 domain-containing protein [Candidatus Bathyarchaeia archaeon]